MTRSISDSWRLSMGRASFRAAARSVVVCAVAALTLVLARQSAFGQAPAPAAAPATGVGTIAGTVLDASSGDPLIDAGVEVVGKNRTVRTDLDGKYRLQLPPGTYA